MPQVPPPVAQRSKEFDAMKLAWILWLSQVLPQPPPIRCA
jgi:hypothetical protein